MNWDLRKDQPYCIYDRFEFDTVVRGGGDCYDRYLVRLGEIRQSLRILEQAVEQFPEEGEIMGKVPRVVRPPEGEVYARIESPRGEIGCYIVSKGKDKPYRLKFRRPSFVNLQILPNCWGAEHDEPDHHPGRNRYCRWGGRLLMANLLNQGFTWTHFLIFAFWGVVMLLIVLGFVTYAIYFERKVIGWMQFRIGPNRVGPLGLLQSVADVLKLLLKEDTIPAKADRELFILAPIITFVPAFVVLATIPFTYSLYNADLNVGLLYYVALSGISTIGIVLGGWASNNKYSLLGGMRSAAQMISYEIPLVLSVIGVIMTSSSLSLREIVIAQEGGFWHWNFLPQIIGFVVFIIAAISELNRTPFDLPEAESELVAGYHVEYSGFRFAFFSCWPSMCTFFCDRVFNYGAVPGRLACSFCLPELGSGPHLVCAEILRRRLLPVLASGDHAQDPGGSADELRMEGVAAVVAAQYFHYRCLHSVFFIIKPEEQGGIIE